MTCVIACLTTSLIQFYKATWVFHLKGHLTSLNDSIWPNSSRITRTFLRESNIKLRSHNGVLQNPSETQLTVRQYYDGVVVRVCWVTLTGTGALNTRHTGHCHRAGTTTHSVV